MKVHALVGLAILATPNFAEAQTKPAPAAASGVCTRLMRTYEGVSMSLADNFTSAVGDNSAPRATLRAMEDANSLTEARIALDLMRDNHCPLPKTTPSYIWYLSPALTCSTDKLKGVGNGAPPSCDHSTWKPMEPDK
jgi:hypothetical protein